MIVPSEVTEYLRSFMEGRRLRGFSAEGAHWDQPGGDVPTIQVTPWAEIQEWAKERDLYEHCRLDAETERDADEEEGEGDDDDGV